MLGLDHPLTGARYELESDGTVTVTAHGRSGSFDGVGRWLGGDVRYADPALCVWLSADRAGPGRGRATETSP